LPGDDGEIARARHEGLARRHLALGHLRIPQQARHSDRRCRPARQHSTAPNSPAEVLGRRCVASSGIKEARLTCTHDRTPLEPGTRSRGTSGSPGAAEPASTNKGQRRRSAGPGALRASTMAQNAFKHTRAAGRIEYAGYDRCGAVRCGDGRRSAGLLPNSRNPRVRNAKYRNRGVQRTRSDRATAPCIRNGAPGECGELFQEIEGGKGERSGKASHGDAEASLLPCNSVVSRPRARCSKRPLVDCSESSMRHEAWGSGGGGRQPQASQPRRLRRPRVEQPGERARTLA
jgi:hypothetical protein